MTWSPAQRIDRICAALWAGASVAAMAAAPLVHAVADFLPACPLRRWTGVPCLSCGGTRALLALTRGDLAEALSFNPLVAGGAVAFVAGGLAAPIWIALGGRAPQLTSLSLRARLTILAAIGVSWVWLVLGPA